MLFDTIDEAHTRTENEKLPWRTPVLTRIDASDAQGSPGNAMDSPVTTS